VQDGPHVAQAEEPLGEQLRPVTPNELHETFPALGIGNPLQHRQTQRAAVIEPAGQQHFGQFFQRRRQALLRRLPRLLRRPGLGRRHEVLHQRAVADLEQLIELRHGTGADRIVAFHAACGLDELARFEPQAAAREPGQQILQLTLPAAGGDDLPGIPFLGQRDVEQ